MKFVRREFLMFVLFNLVSILLSTWCIYMSSPSSFSFLHPEMEGHKHLLRESFTLALATQSTMGILNMYPSSSVGLLIISVQQCMNLVARVALASSVFLL
jgi:hypothetical protein